MRLSLSVLSAALLASTSVYGATQVNVYEGPTECEDSEKIAPMNYLSMHYTGTIDESSATGEKGSKFDSSRDRNSPFDFQVGAGQVIKGWDEGLIGLCKGAKATLVIPPEEGYGEQGAGGAIPGGATLNFDVEVLGISSDAPPQPNLFVDIDTDKDGKISTDEVKAYFVSQGQGDQVDIDEVMKHEDKDQDGFISWEEFSGPKGDAPTGDEL
eukprot:CAMPEP_0172481976 /NCGR_PEP_ID=MMETSP1066-20121228/8212_1 /TAXON_ID=671091 /ORGANISM="Coscinodiscus wailesii, Strain CCMP2513" /LENGTH=211 /DNA_ID=CAMNT_0013244787 /DNA_START=84 /DNA_END=719 /DNA_ORIENTATION=+